MKKLFNMAITKEQKDLILGTMLGDGYLNKRENNVRLQMIHGPNQEDYIKHKSEVLNNLLTERGLKKETFKDKYSVTGFKTCFNFYTISHEYLSFLRQLFYPNDKKVISEDILERLNERSLAYWIMDDGSLNKRKGKIRTDGTRIYVGARFIICTCSKDGKQEETICKKLKEKFDLDFNVRLHKKNCYVVSCTTETFKKLVELVKPYIIPSMLYKIDTEFLGSFC